MSNEGQYFQCINSAIEVMEQYEKTDSVAATWVPFLFAEDLVSYQMEFRNITWTPSFSYHAFRERLETTFSPEIGRAVSLVPAYFNTHLENIKTELTHRFLADAHHFSSFTYYLADKIFTSDLFLELIVFCGCVIHVAEHLCRLGHPEFLDHAVVGIAFTFDNKLKHNFEAQGNWETFKLYCTEFTSARNMEFQSGIYLHQHTETKQKQTYDKQFLRTNSSVSYR